MKKSGGNWKILYHPAVVKKDISKLGKPEAQRIELAIEQKLSVNPLIYGIPLRGTLKQFWKLRVGVWRIVFTIVDKEVHILVIAHRRESYEVAEGRRYYFSP